MLGVNLQMVWSCEYRWTLQTFSPLYIGQGLENCFQIFLIESQSHSFKYSIRACLGAYGNLRGTGTLSNTQLLAGIGACGLALSCMQAPLLEHAQLADRKSVV